MSAAERVLYTIGHSNHSAEKFLGLLKEHGVEMLIDTRSQPHSKYVAHFNVPEIRAAATAVGIRYLFMGQELGGRPQGEAFYDADGYVLYRKLAESSRFLEGIQKLEQEADAQRVAIFCSEENPSVCHRRLLIGRVLSERGTTLLHIRGSGQVQSDAELSAEETAQKNAGGQQALFESEEVAEWKSLQSVLPKRLPRSSSAS